MQVDSKVLVAVTGYGNWGRNLVRNFSDLGVLAAGCDTSSEQRNAFRRAYGGVPVFDDFEAVLSDPAISAVAIATPAATHGDLVRLALKAGKDVFVEKPLALDYKDGARLVALEEERQAAHDPVADVVLHSGLCCSDAHHLKRLSHADGFFLPY